MRTKTIIRFFEKLPKPVLTFIACLLVVGIGYLDYITGYDFSVSSFYLFPVILVAWFEGGVPATLISIFSAITWAVADLASGHVYSHISVAVWNAMMILALFLIVAYFIILLKKLSIRERRGSGRRQKMIRHKK
jgi:K+-sensing histidine kinase KdpD